MKRLVATLAAVITLIAAASARQATVERFRFERPIDTSGAGPRRLAVDVPLLTGAQPSLSDLRLFDEKGAAVPYILLQSQVRRQTWSVGQLLPIAATDKASGFEADFQYAQPMDGIRVVGLPPPFLKRLVLEGSGDREHWTLLAGEGTLFDLPDEGLRQTDVSFPSGTYRYVRVTWDDRNSGRVPLPNNVQARHLTGFIPPPALTARVPVERRGSEPGRSRYRVKLPAPHLPITAIDVIVPADVHVFRQAVVRESQLSGTSVQSADLGRARLMQVAHDGAVAGAMRIPILAPSEPEIHLVIEDGNNAPLDVKEVALVFENLPWIYFEAPAGAVTARYGDPSAGHPSYDLEAVRDAVRIESVANASWGIPRPTASAPVATLAPAPPLPDTGSVLDASLFAVRRAIPDGPAGLVALALDADALAQSRGPDSQFADVRVIDESNRQVPYVVERRDEPLEIAVSLERREPPMSETPTRARRNRSSYVIRLPYTELPSAQLVVETSARVFQRRVELLVERPADRDHRASWPYLLATTTWSHVDNDEAASALVVPLQRVDTKALWLSIDEGDNSALPLTGGRLLLPSYRLRFYRRPGATLRLVYGRVDLAAPRYDLALLAPQVLGVEAQELAAVPASGERGGVSFALISPRAFWIFLTSAVLVLLGLIVRLARQQDAAPRP